MGRHGVAAAPDQPTFTRDVAPILHARCVTVPPRRRGRADGAAAPTRMRGRGRDRSRTKVVSRQMPPWFAEPGVGAFANDPRLTDAEIATIAKWVDAGAPQGDLKDMPTPPRVHRRLAARRAGSDHRAAGGADSGDRRRCTFRRQPSRSDLKEDRWIRAIEIRPSNRQVAHHSVIFRDQRRRG